MQRLDCIDMAFAVFAGNVDTFTSISTIDLRSGNDGMCDAIPTRLLTKVKSTGQSGGLINGQSCLG